MLPSITAGQSAPPLRPRPSVTCLYLGRLWSKEHPLSLGRYDVSTFSYRKRQNTTALPLALVAFKPLGIALIGKARFILCSFFEELGELIRPVRLVVAYELFVQVCRRTLPAAAAL